MACWDSDSSLKSPRCKAERGRRMSRPSALLSASVGIRVVDGGCSCCRSTSPLAFSRRIISFLSVVGVGLLSRSSPSRILPVTNGL